MNTLSIILSDEQESQLNKMVQETGLTSDHIVNSAINEFYNNYEAWKRRLSFEKKVGGKE